MMLSQTAEYALRATASLASCPGRLVPTAELAERAGVPMPYLAKVLQQLAAAELIRGRRGVGGGYTLNRPLEEISLFDVISAVSVVRVPKQDDDSAEPVAKDHALESLERVVHEAASSALRVYQTVTVADLAKTPCAAGEPDTEHGDRVNGQASSFPGNRRGNGAAHREAATAFALTRSN
ncbi:MAG: Rrf2 family transcriptional regulator [Phycisphaerales bacterium]